MCADLSISSWRNAATFPQGGAVVAVSQQFVEENNLLPGAAPTLGNASEFHYLVAGYHQLHCLVRYRFTIYTYMLSNSK